MTRALATIECAECLFSPAIRPKTVLLTSANSSSGAFVRRVFPEIAIRELALDTPLDLLGHEEDILRHSNILDVLRAADVQSLFLGHRSSPFIEDWGRRNGIRLLCTPWSVQSLYEDKLYFQAFLDRHRIQTPPTQVLHSADDISRVSAYPVVVQHPAVEPVFPLVIARSKQDLQRIVSEHQEHVPLLCRSRVNGLPIGMTLLIGKHQYIFSAPRLQCFADPQDISLFLGIHWFAASRLPGALKRTLEHTLTCLADALQAEGFLGVANVDLILTPEGAYVLECNPRMSSATPCIAMEPSLFHGLDFAAEFLRSIDGSELTAHIPRLAETPFEGSYIEFDYLAERIASNLQSFSPPSSGCYRWIRGDHVLQETQGTFSKPNEYFFLSALPPESPTSALKSVGTVFTNFPLFTFEGFTSPSLSPLGNAFLGEMQRSMGLPALPPFSHAP